MTHVLADRTHIGTIDLVAAWSDVSADQGDTCVVHAALQDWVALSPRVTPGWPWPGDSYGLGPMYGDDGWCRGCGSPSRDQSGPLVMQGSKFPTASVWMPNWLYDVVCVSAAVAAEIADRFALSFGDVHKPGGGPTGVKQILPSVASDAWYRTDDVSRAVRARHCQDDGERTGASCTDCGRWKWLPVSEDEVPILGGALSADAAVIASPERFGDGLSSFRHLLFRRPLAEALAGASPRNWHLVEVEIA